MKETVELNIPVDLIESIKRNECVLFVASGLSSKVIRSNKKPLPDWKNFMLELLAWAQKNRVPFNSEPSEIKEMIEKGNYLMAAQELHELINPNDFSDFLNDVFRDSTVKPTKSHELLTKIPFRAILTTNYDTLIEGAYSVATGGQIPKKYTQHDLIAAMSPLRKRDFFIFKMHGDIDRPETIVLGSRSYTNLLYKSPDYLSFLETLFTTHTVLFIGFGGSDPDFDYVIDRLSTIFSRTLNKHFILAPVKKFNFTERRRLLLDRRLEVIEYEVDSHHTKVDEFIEQLYNVINDIEAKHPSKEKRSKEVYAIISTIDDDKYGNKIEKFINAIPHKDVLMWSNLEYFFEKKSSIKDFYDGGYPDKIILLLTESALKSNNFENEIELALLKELDDRFSLIPIAIGNIEIPYKLRNKFIVTLPENFNNRDLEAIEEYL